MIPDPRPATPLVIPDPRPAHNPVTFFFNRDELEVYMSKKETAETKAAADAEAEAETMREQWVYVGRSDEQGFAIAPDGTIRMGMTRGAARPWKLFEWHDDEDDDFTFSGDNEMAGALLTFAIHMPTFLAEDANRDTDLPKEFQKIETRFKEETPGFLSAVADYARGIVDGPH